MKILFLIFVAVVLFSVAAYFWFSRSSRAESLPELKNPRLIVKKKERKLEVFDGEKLLRTYKIAVGFESEGDKQKEGDGKTPEGKFLVLVKNPKSKFYLSLGLNYPHFKHAEKGLREKLISQSEYNEILAALKSEKLPPQKTALGGEIYIHGGGNLWDWTAGCVALRDEEIKELFDAIPIKTEVVIEP